MKVEALNKLKEILLTKYPHSSTDIGNYFDDTIKQFIKGKTTIILLNRNLTIERRVVVNRMNVKQSYDIPEFESMEPSVFHSRVKLSTPQIITKKRYHLIDYKEPLIYLEEE